MSAKPTLGYPTRTEALFALRREGKTTKQIAALMGVAPKTISALVQSAYRKRAPRPAEDMGRTVVIPIDVLDSLKAAADERKMTVNALVRKIVETVADEGLVGAVLDDGR